jgi:hypothetical protein
MIDTVDRSRRTSGSGARPARADAARSRARVRLIGGDIFHGALSLDQLFSARPVLGNADTGCR